AVARSARKVGSPRRSRTGRRQFASLCKPALCRCAHRAQPRGAGGPGCHISAKLPAGAQLRLGMLLEFRIRPTANRGPGMRIVGIGASAGGLESLEQLFKALPADTGMAFVVVQHLSPDFRSLMDELIARHSA